MTGKTKCFVDSLLPHAPHLLTPQETQQIERDYGSLLEFLQKHEKFFVLKQEAAGEGEKGGTAHTTTTTTTTTTEETSCGGNERKGRRLPSNLSFIHFAQLPSTQKEHRGSNGTKESEKPQPAQRWVVTHRVTRELLGHLQHAAVSTLMARGGGKTPLNVSVLAGYMPREVRSFATGCGCPSFGDFLKRYFPHLMSVHVSAVKTMITVDLAKSCVCPFRGKAEVPSLEMMRRNFVLSMSESERGERLAKSVNRETQKIEHESRVLKTAHGKNYVPVLGVVADLIYEVLPEDGTQIDMDLEIKPQLPVTYKMIPQLGKKLASCEFPKLSISLNDGRYHFGRRMNKDNSLIKDKNGKAFPMVDILTTTSVKCNLDDASVVTLPSSAISNLVDQMVPLLPSDGSEVRIDDPMFKDIFGVGAPILGLSKKIFKLNHKKIYTRYIGTQYYVKLRPEAVDQDLANERKALDIAFWNAGLYLERSPLPMETHQAFRTLRDALPADGTALELEEAKALLPHLAPCWPAGMAKKLNAEKGIKVTQDAANGLHYVARSDVYDGSESLLQSVVSSLNEPKVSSSPDTMKGLTPDYTGLNLDLTGAFEKLWNIVPTTWVGTDYLMPYLKGTFADLSSRRILLRIAVEFSDYFEFSVGHAKMNLLLREERFDMYKVPFEPVIRRRVRISPEAIPVSVLLSSTSGEKPSKEPELGVSSEPDFAEECGEPIRNTKPRKKEKSFHKVEKPNSLEPEDKDTHSTPPSVLPKEGEKSASAKASATDDSTVDKEAEEEEDEEEDVDLDEYVFPEFSRKSPIQELTSDFVLRLAFATPSHLTPIPRIVGGFPPGLREDLVKHRAYFDAIARKCPSLFQYLDQSPVDDKADGKSDNVRVGNASTGLVRSFVHDLAASPGSSSQPTPKEREGEESVLLRLLINVVRELSGRAGGCAVEDISLALSPEELNRMPQKDVEGMLTAHPDIFEISDDGSLVSVRAEKERLRTLFSSRNEKRSRGRRNRHGVMVQIDTHRGRKRRTVAQMVTLSDELPEGGMSEAEITAAAQSFAASHPTLVHDLHEQLLSTHHPLSRDQITALLFYTTDASLSWKREKRLLERIRSLNTTTNTYNDERSLIQHIVDSLPAIGEVKVSTLVHALLDHAALQVLPPSLRDLFDAYHDLLAYRVDDTGMWVSRPQQTQGVLPEGHTSAYQREDPSRARRHHARVATSTATAALDPMAFPFPLPRVGDEEKVLAFAIPPFSMLGDEAVRFQLPQTLRYLGQEGLVRRYRGVLETMPGKKVRWPYVCRRTEVEMEGGGAEEAEQGQKEFRKGESPVDKQVERRWVTQMIRLLPKEGKPRRLEEIRGRVQPDLRAQVPESAEVGILQRYPSYVNVEVTNLGGGGGRSFLGSPERRESSNAGITKEMAPSDPSCIVRLRRSFRLVALGEARRNWAVVMYALVALNVKHVQHNEARKSERDIPAEKNALEKVYVPEVTFEEFYTNTLPPNMKQVLRREEILDLLERCVYVELCDASGSGPADVQKRLPAVIGSRSMAGSNKVIRERACYGARMNNEAGDGTEAADGEKVPGAPQRVDEVALTEAVEAVRKLTFNDTTGKIFADLSMVGNLLHPSHLLMIRSLHETSAKFFVSYPDVFEVHKIRTGIHGVRLIDPKNLDSRRGLRSNQASTI